MTVEKQQDKQLNAEQGKPLTGNAKPPVVSVASQQILAPKRSKPNVMQSSSWMSITGK